MIPRKIFANCTGDEPWLPHGQHVARGLAKVWQFFADGWNVDPLWSWRAREDDFFSFVPEKVRTPPNEVEPENVPDLMFVEPEVPEVGEAEEDPPATSSGSDLYPLHHLCNYEDKWEK